MHFIIGNLIREGFLNNLKKINKFNLDIKRCNKKCIAFCTRSNLGTKP